METKFTRFLDLENKEYNKEEIIHYLSDIFHTEYECTEEDIKNVPDDDEDTEYHSVFTSVNSKSSITINYDKSTKLIVAPLQIN